MMRCAPRGFHGGVALAASLGLSIGLFASALSATPTPQTVTGDAAALDALLGPASTYAATYFGAMANLTAEERYVQELLGMRTMRTGPANLRSPETVGGRRRELRSDIVLIEVGPPYGWRVYRDVFEVDGTPVRERGDRLAHLFLEPAESARIQAERIAEESARFNISNMGRVLNEPGLPLVFLLPSLRPHFTFSLDRRDDPGVWIVRFEETARPTLFWHNRTIPNPSTGRFWIEADTGVVRRAEHTVSPPNFKATFVTEFDADERFGIAVPDEMREQLWTGVGPSARRVEGVATYSNYRQFAVTTQTAPSK